MGRLDARRPVCDGVFQLRVSPQHVKRVCGVLVGGKLQKERSADNRLIIEEPSIIAVFTAYFSRKCRKEISSVSCSINIDLSTLYVFFLPHGCQG